MPYIGKNPVGGGFHKLDALTASATDTYALTLNSAAYYPESANQLLVSLNGVIQAPQDSFTVSGSNLVFDTALTASDSIDFVVALGDVLAVQTVTDGAITTAKLGNGAVTSAKLDTNIAVSGNLDVGTIRDAAGTNTAMTIDSNGIITQGSPVGFSAAINSDLSITANSTRLTGWNITTGMYGGFNTDGAGGTMLNLTSGIAQVPVTGYYSIVLNCRIDSFAGSYHYIDVIKTDSSGTYSSATSTLIVRSLESATASDYTELQIQSVAYLQANDYIAAYWSNSGDNSVTVDNESYFSMFKVG